MPLEYIFKEAAQKGMKVIFEVWISWPGYF